MKGLEKIGLVIIVLGVVFLFLRVCEDEANASSGDRPMKELVKAERRQAKAMEDIVRILRDLKNESKGGKGTHRVSSLDVAERCSEAVCAEWYPCKGREPKYLDNREGAPCTWSECWSQWSCE